MCSSRGDGPVGADADLVSPLLGRRAPTTLAARIHDALDGLLESDLSYLSEDEHTQLVTSLVKAQSRLQAATLDAVAAFDAADVASTSRHRTTKRWVESRTRLSAGASAALVRQARALRDHLPGTRDALAAGSITPHHASVIATVVRTVGEEYASSAESILLRLARRADPATVGRATAAILAEVHPEKAEKALHDAYERRGLRVRVVGQHGYLDGVFDIESTELMQSALMPLMSPAGDDDKRTSEQRRADAFLDIIGRHLAHEDMPVQGGHRPHLSVVVNADQLPQVEDGSQAAAGADVSGTVTVLPDGAGLPDGNPGDSLGDNRGGNWGGLGGTAGGNPGAGEEPGRSRGWAGVVSLSWTSAAVPAAAARRWICDAVVTPVIARLLGRMPAQAAPGARSWAGSGPSSGHGPWAGSGPSSGHGPWAATGPDSGPVFGADFGDDSVWLPLAVGRSQRTATPAQLKALSVRDGGCIHPGCTRTAAYCDAHHVIHWVDGGPTDLSNLVFLCRHHHRTLHAGHWAIEPDPGTPGLFWTRDQKGVHPAQTARERSPQTRLPAA